MRRSTAGSSSTATTSVWLKMVWSGIVLCVGASVWASWMHLHQQQNQQHHLQQQKMQQQHLQHLQHLQQQTIPTPLQFSSSTTTTTTTNRGGVAAGLLEFAQKSQPHNHQTPRNQKKHQQSQQQQRKDLSSSYPTLQCQAFGGPSVQDAQEMVYWQGACVRACVRTTLRV